MQFLKVVKSTEPVDIDAAELITLTDAAKLLRIQQHALSALIDRGGLTRYIDTTEPNPTKAGRVLKSEVLAEIARRKGRGKYDARLKPAAKKRKRKPPTPEG